MKAGAVIVDLSAEGGGNCEDTVPGETTRVGQVTIVAPFNVPSLLGEDASALRPPREESLRSHHAHYDPAARHRTR